MFLTNPVELMFFFKYVIRTRNNMSNKMSIEYVTRIIVV